MNHRLASSATRVALATAGLIFAAGPAISQTVGKTAAVNPASTASGKVLTLGSEIIHKERIRTSDTGSLQLLFLDRSTMNIGPNSDVVIDEYIFDPRTNTGKMTVSLGKGLMRFVGGQISHDGNAMVKTPSATIGIRGAVGSFTYDPSTKLTTASNDCKDCSITITAPNGQSVTIPPGHTATLGSDGKITLAPTPQDASDKNLRQTQSKGGQNGGTDNETSQDAANHDTQLTQNSPPPPPPPPPPPLSPPPPPPPLPPPPPPAAFNASPFALAMGNCCEAADGNSLFSHLNSPAPAGAPFLHPDLADVGDPLISPVLGYRNASAPGATVPEPGKFLQYSMDIVNSEAGQNHWMIVAVGSMRNDGSGGLVAEGGFVGTGNQNSNAPGMTQGTFSSPAGQVTTNSGRLPTAATITENFYNPATGQYSNNPATYTQGNDSATQAPTEFSFTQTATPTAVPAGLGSDRPAITLQGFVGGIMRSEQLIGEGGGPPSHFIVGNQNDAATDFTVILDPANSSVTASMSLSNKNAGGPAGVEFTTALLKFGGGAATDPTRSAYVDYDNFAALDQRTVTNDGEGGTTSTPTSTINTLALEKSDGYLINATPAIKQKIETTFGVTTCQCEYTRWGFWSMTSKQTVDGGTSYDDRGSMNLWVAGRRPTIAEVPTTGTATYSGHIVANVQTSSNSYLAAGSFTNSVDFGSRQIGSTASFDNANYSGTLTINNADRRNFGGSLSGDYSRSMDMNGSFFRGKTSPVGEMGGSVRVTGTNYMAGGIFAGKRN